LISFTLLAFRAFSLTTNLFDFGKRYCVIFSAYIFQHTTRKNIYDNLQEINRPALFLVQCLQPINLCFSYSRINCSNFIISSTWSLSHYVCPGFSSGGCLVTCQVYTYSNETSSSTDNISCRWNQLHTGVIWWCWSLCSWRINIYCQRGYASGYFFHNDSFYFLLFMILIHSKIFIYFIFFHIKYAQQLEMIEMNSFEWVSSIKWRNEFIYFISSFIRLD